MTDGDPPPRYASIPVGVSANSLLRIPVGSVVVVGTLVAGFALAVPFKLPQRRGPA